MCGLSSFSWHCFLLSRRIFLILIKSRLFIISFTVHTFVVISKILLPSPSPRSSRIFSMLSFRTFIVLYFNFRSMIHLCYFVKDIRSVCRFYFFSLFLACGIQLFKHHLLRTLYLFHWIACVPLPQICWLYIYMDLYFWAVYSVPLIYLFLLLTPHYLDYCGFIGSLEVS